MTELQIEITITELSRAGHGLGSAKDEKIYEVPFTLPGDTVKALVSSEGKAALISVITPSPLRVAPRCIHFGKCGGCKLQHIPQKGQLLHKEKIIREIFASSITSGTVVHPIMASKMPWNYRGKMDYTFSRDEKNKAQLGLIENGTKGKVISLEECHISPKWFIDALFCIKQWWEFSKIPHYNPLTNKGVLRYLTLREGRRSGDRMIILTVANQSSFDLNIGILEKFVAQVIEYVKPHQQENQLSIYLRILQAQEGATSNHYDMLLSGPGFIREGLKISLSDDKEATNLQFQIGPSAFFQPNPQQTELFYSKALQMIGLSEGITIYDLYCGTGVLGVCASKYVKNVISVDLSSESASSARANAKLNNCENLKVYSGAVRHVLNQLAADGSPIPDVVIVNPPRSGLDAEAHQHLVKLNPAIILYISCNPKTQAENVLNLLKHGYYLAELQPVDQFPQTNHIENIALLKREK